MVPTKTCLLLVEETMPIVLPTVPTWSTRPTKARADPDSARSTLLSFYEERKDPPHGGGGRYDDRHRPSPWRARHQRQPNAARTSSRQTSLAAPGRRSAPRAPAAPHRSPSRPRRGRSSRRSGSTTSSCREPAISSASPISLLNASESSIQSRLRPRPPSSASRGPRAAARAAPPARPSARTLLGATAAPRQSPAPPRRAPR